MDAAQQSLLTAVDEVCRTFRGSVTSWWRSPRHNASLASAGSVTNSQHMKGLAMDVTYDGEPPPAQGVKNILARYSPSLQLVREGTHDHIEQDPSLLSRFGAGGGGPVSAISSRSTDSPAAAISASTSSRPSSTATSTAALGAPVRSAGPGSSPIDRLFKGRP